MELSDQYVVCYKYASLLSCTYPSTKVLEDSPSSGSRMYNCDEALREHASYCPRTYFISFLCAGIILLFLDVQKLCELIKEAGWVYYLLPKNLFLPWYQIPWRCRELCSLSGKRRRGCSCLSQWSRQGKDLQIYSTPVPVSNELTNRLLSPDRPLLAAKFCRHPHRATSRRCLLCFFQWVLWFMSFRCHLNLVANRLTSSLNLPISSKVSRIFLC